MLILLCCKRRRLAVAIFNRFPEESPSLFGLTGHIKSAIADMPQDRRGLNEPEEHHGEFIRAQVRADLTRLLCLPEKFRPR